MCRKLLCEVVPSFKFMPQLEKRFSYLYENILLNSGTCMLHFVLSSKYDYNNILGATVQWNL